MILVSGRRHGPRRKLGKKWQLEKRFYPPGRAVAVAAAADDAGGGRASLAVSGAQEFGDPKRNWVHCLMMQMGETY